MASSNNIAAYSTDGITWTKSTLINSTNGNWYSVCYGNGKFVAVAYNSNIAAYIDESALTGSNSTWTQIDMPAYKCWYSVCHAENLQMFFALDYYSPWGAYCIVETTGEMKRLPKGWYYYSNIGEDSINHNFVSNFRGDMYFTTNSEVFRYDNGSMNTDESTNEFLIDVGTIYYDITSKNEAGTGTKKEYVGAGLYRMTMPMEKLISEKPYYFTWEVKEIGNVPLQTLYAGSTLPVNITLFYGANGATEHAYQWQSNSSGTITTYDTTAAVKQVTIDACTKLKGDWNENKETLRIYLIKFCKQGTDADYSYLNSCATGTSAPYMYDVSTQEQLDQALGKIYEDIKKWVE